MSPIWIYLIVAVVSVVAGACIAVSWMQKLVDQSLYRLEQATALHEQSSAMVRDADSMHAEAKQTLLDAEHTLLRAHAQRTPRIPQPGSGQMPEPVEYSVQEGGLWMRWPPKRHTFGPGVPVFAVRFSDGRVFDTHLGWRVSQPVENVDAHEGEETA